MAQFDVYENPNLASQAAGTHLVVIDRGDKVVINCRTICCHQF